MTSPQHDLPTRTPVGVSAPDPVLRVTEIFRSIQGESTYTGLPCTFIRLTGCDLRCVWCDTDYSFHGGEAMPLGEILDHVRGLNTRLVEVTGGEPLLHPATPDLVRSLCEAGFTVLVETGGHRPIADLDPRAVRIMDIKCPGSGMSHRNCWENLAQLTFRDEVKFVIADRSDFDWACTIIREHGLAERCPVLVSPVQSVLRPEVLAEWVLESGLPVRFQLQIHKAVWPDRVRSF